MHLADVPSAVRWIVRTLEEAGFETWTVGGAVRDALAGNPVGDWDLTTRATPPEMRRLFPRTVPVGVDHGTMGILDREGTLYEVTTFRRDVETKGRHAVVSFAQTLDEDLGRRDFTINAVAWHPLKEVVHDPFGGVADMEARILRTVGDPAARFAEDYLRVLRALRFAGVFDLRIEDETWRALCGAVGHLGILSPERIREEMDKLLASEAPPSRSLSLYATSGALAALYPELDRMRGVERGEGGGDWFAHTLRTLDLLSRGAPPLHWAALLHGIGAPGGVAEDPPLPGEGMDSTPSEGESLRSDRDGERRAEVSSGRPSARDAATPIRIPGARTLLRAAALLERLRSSNARIREVSELARAAALPPLPEASDPELRRWVAMAGRGNVKAVLRIWEASLRADEQHGGPWTRDRYRVLAERLGAIAHGSDPLSVGELAISGKDLVRMGSRPGPHFGEILGALLEQVLDKPSRNEAGYLEGQAQRMLDDLES